jgi:Xaa-Pro aminopeptidase
VLADFGCTVNGLCSDVTRTVCFGASSGRQRRLYAIVKQAQAAARAAARPGCAGGVVDAAGRSVITRAGYGRAFGHSLGHGLGRRVHEHPRVSSKSTDVLDVGSVFTIEPGIYLPGWGGIRIEDVAVVGKKGATLLTSSPDNLFEIKI